MRRVWRDGVSWTGRLAIGLVVLLLLLGCTATAVYVVQPGDSLQDIARTHDITVPDLVQANQQQYPLLAADPQSLKPGMELVIPARQDLSVQAEQWLVRIARAASPPVTPAPSVPAAPNDKINAIVQLIWQGVNRERAAHNLKPLAFDANLVQIAQRRSNDMIKRQYFSHTDPETGRVAFQELIRSNRYLFGFAGENIAEIKNQGSFVPSGLTVYARYDATELADQFVSGWINSPEHHENILNAHFQRTGIALGVSVDGTRVVATQLFSD